jgi:uncharacterized RDD family membrane protein YckC
VAKDAFDGKQSGSFSTLLSSNRSRMKLESSETASSQDNSQELAAIYEPIQFPSLLARIKAIFLDTLVLLVFFAVTSVVIDNVGGAPDAVRIALIMIIFLYDPVLTAFAGATIGHKIMGIKVRKFDAPGSKISLPMAFVRFFVKWLLGWISLLTVTSNAHKRAIHDLASGSIMIPASSIVL